MRNSRTYSPLCSPLLLLLLVLYSLDYKCTTGKQRGWCYRRTGERGKLTERCFRSTMCISESGKKMSKEKMWGKKWVRKGGSRALFRLRTHPTHCQGGPRRERRLIGSFGLEKWISPPKKLVSFQTKWQMSPSICCLQSRVHSAPSAHMMGLITTGSLRFTDSSPGHRTATRVLYFQPCCYVKHSGALLCSM